MENTLTHLRLFTCVFSRRGHLYRLSAMALLIQLWVACDSDSSRDGGGAIAADASGDSNTDGASHDDGRPDAATGTDGSAERAPVQIVTLSNRADLVSGGDALVEIVPPADSSTSGLSVTVAGRDVTSAFTVQSDGRILGVVTGLVEGENVVRAQVTGARAAALTIRNYPRQGPIISGSHVAPFYCATPTPQPASGNTPSTNAGGLSGAPDADCNIASETKLYYRTTAAAASPNNTEGCSPGLPDPVYSTTGTDTMVPAAPTRPANPCWKDFTAGDAAPADIAMTTTDTGVEVPFIVRIERGTMNRGIYDIAVLFDPNRAWTATAPQSGWNNKLYYSFGASTGQPRRQARPQGSWTSSEEQLKRGYLVALNSMTDSSRNSNRVLMSETVMMMKEHISDTYGPIRFTVGSGCSGGSINSNMTASISPGLLDGIVTSCTYPDSETTTIEVGDCSVLVEAYQKPPLTSLWSGLTQAQINAKKAAINGHVDQSACHGWFNAFGSNGKAGLYSKRAVSDNVTGAITQQPTVINNCELPNTAVYDPANPVATADLPRCNAWSWAESIWGKVPGSPQAYDTRDNVGVQYGLKALLEGQITPEEFVTLNEVVGGVDHDSTPRPERTTADPQALSTAYRAGIVASGRQLAKTAIIDLRGWDESNINVPPGVTPNPTASPIHHEWFSQAVRDRIVRDAVDANNQALWRFARTGLAASATLSLEAFLAMDQWISVLKDDSSSDSLQMKVRHARPTSGERDTRDFCLLPNDAAQATRVFDLATCDADAFLKPTLSPRQVAGGPRSEDVLKCQLKAINMADYAGITFTSPQWTRLQAVFTAGVCDWTKSGVGQEPAAGGLIFRDGPGGQPIGDAPVSTAE
jgi:hypothetical protein